MIQENKFMEDSSESSMINYYSTDESLMEMRLSQPGLTMQGMCSSNIFDNTSLLGFADRDIFETALKNEKEHGQNLNGEISDES
jgi:hypothetical protein